MMVNMQGKLKMEFPNYNCFPSIAKLIVRSHYLLLHLVQMLRSYRKMHILMFLFIVIPRAQYQNNMLKHYKNSHANIGTICKYLGNTVNRNML